MKKVCILLIGLIAAAGVVFGVMCLSAYIFMLLWNFVLPLFGVITLTFWQSFCAVLLLGFIGGKLKGNSNNTDLKKALQNVKTSWKRVSKDVDDIAEPQKDVSVEVEVTVPDNLEVTAKINGEKVEPIKVECTDTPNTNSEEKPKKSSRRRNRKKKEADKPTT